MLAAYTANLASLLVAKRTVQLEDINTIDDAIRYEKTMCVAEFSHAHEYVQRMYPQSQSYFVPVPDLNKYDALNNGTCDLLIGKKQEFETVKYQTSANPDCKLLWEGRIIESLGDAFATKLDTGHKCTLLVNEVFNFYLRQMEETGYLQELWNQHVQNYADPGHCSVGSGVGTGGGSGTTRNRQLTTASGDKAIVATESSINVEEEDPEQHSLTLTEMAGTFLFQLVGSVLAVIVTIISYFEKQYHRRDPQKETINEETERNGKPNDNNNNNNNTNNNNNNINNNSNCGSTVSERGGSDDIDGTTNELAHMHHRLNNLESSQKEINQKMATIQALLKNISAKKK